MEIGGVGAGAIYRSMFAFCMIIQPITGAIPKFYACRYTSMLFRIHLDL